MPHRNFLRAYLAGQYDEPAVDVSGASAKVGDLVMNVTTAETRFVVATFADGRVGVSTAFDLPWSMKWERWDIRVLKAEEGDRVR